MSANILLDQMMNSQRSSADAMTYIEDVFSTFLHIGNGSTQHIVNGINLDEFGGMVWLKDRDQANHNGLFDTDRGATNYLSSNLTQAEDTVATMLTSFNSDGFSLGSWDWFNADTKANVSWTFRQAPRFFYQEEVVKAGSADKTVDLSSLVDVGMVFVKRTDVAGSWYVWHKELTAGKLLYLEQTAAEATLGHITMSGTTLTLEDGVIADGDYIVYAWADDPLGPSEDGSDGLIACGSYEGNGSADGPEISLGWEPQYIMIRRATGGIGSWCVFDMMRGIVTGGVDYRLMPDLSDTEYSVLDTLKLLPTGFKLSTLGTYFNSTGDDYIYMAIRRPMKTPESSSECFAIDNSNSSDVPAWESGFPIDMAITRATTSAVHNHIHSRLMQGKGLYANTTGAEYSESNAQFDYMDGFWSNTQTSVDYAWMWKRAPGWHDICTWVGTAANRTIEHNLQTPIEMMWVKEHDGDTDWVVYHAGMGNTKYIALNLSQPSATSSTRWNDTSPTDTTFSLGTYGGVNGFDDLYIAFLFCTLPGISKCGSYTGNGSTQNLDMGFASGAKVVIFKATSTTGNWVMVDSERGIVSGNDPYLLLNSTAAEDTDEDCVDPYAAGITINETTAANINTNSVEYIYYAIAI